MFLFSLCMSECIVVLFFLLSLVLSDVDFSDESEVKAQVSKQQEWFLI